LKFEDLYNSNKNLVYNLALQYVQNCEDAEEITQDVFVSVHKSLNSFKEQSKLSTWIHRITINKSLDFIKSRQRKKRFGIFYSLFSENSIEVKYEKPEFNHPGVQLENKEALQQLFKNINQLSDNQKTALILSKIEQKTQAEIAEIMNLSNKAVESLIQRAKTSLQKNITSQEGN
jgi:RNA polymerase sigma factor (sigma-70 family)